MVILSTLPLRPQVIIPKQIYKKLRVGSPVAIDRAYGHMLLNQGRDKQVWIAGIGITPFISYIRRKSCP